MQIVPFSESIVRTYFSHMKNLSSQLPDEYWEEEHYLKDLPGKWELSFVLLHDGKLAGFSMSSLTNNSVHINRIVIAAEHQRTGAGALLMKLNEENAKLQNREGVTLKVHISNKEAINWYLKKEFLIISTDGNYHLMKKLIAS